jgi:hypothetical protein
VEAVRGSGETRRVVPSRDNVARCSPGNGSGDATQGWRVVAWVEDFGIWINCAGTEDSADRNRGQRPWGLESRGGRWERDSQREREREREEAQESGREESGQVEDNWISIVFFFSPPVVSIFLFLGLVLFFCLFLLSFNLFSSLFSFFSLLNYYGHCCNI